MVSYPGTVNGNQTVTGNQTVNGNATVKGTLNVSPGAVVNIGTTNLYDNAGNLQTDDYFVAPNGQSNATWTAFGVDPKALAAGSAGGGLAVKEGSNARMGTLTLNGATPVVVANTSVTANTRIFLTPQLAGGTPAHFWVSGRSAGVSFTVTGTAGDTSTVAYLLVEPY